MLVPNQLVEVKPNYTTVKHYRQLGYDVSVGQIILVPPEHLTYGSKAIVEVICDVCHKKMNKQYKKYIERHTYDMDCCMECKYIKAKQTNQIVYGVNNPAQAQEVQEKMRCTNLQRYGVANASSANEIKEKRKQTFAEKYKEGHYSKTEEFKMRVRETNIKKFGYPNPMQNPEISAKARQTLNENGTCPTSKPQLELYNMVKMEYRDAQLNYPYSMCSLDVFINIDDIKIDLEYDGGFWHRNKVKDLCRDKYLQNEGFKVIRIRSGILLPTEEELFSAINELATTDRKFKEIKLKDWKEYEEENEEVV